MVAYTLLHRSAHKSSKKLLEQCQHMERVWGHVFTHTITLSEAVQNTWFSKLLDLIHITQQQQLWVSETKVRLLMSSQVVVVVIFVVQGLEQDKE